MNDVLDPVLGRFDVVKVRHYNLPDYKATHVALVQGLQVFIGIAKVHPVDQFNKRKGLQIAVGRAVHEWKVASGITRKRKDHNWGVMVTAGSKDEVYSILTRAVFTRLPEPKGCSGKCESCKCG